MGLLRNIHLGGFWHEDFAERNVLWAGQKGKKKYRIIDFQIASHHNGNCDCAENYTEKNGLPTRDDLTCPEMVGICLQFEIWPRGK